MTAKTHGQSRRGAWSPEYTCWAHITQRCINQKSKDWPNYGGRGIRVCQRWLTFENFYADMGPRPDGMSIDRIDNDGNYEPGNCRWATRAEQNSNQRKRKDSGKHVGVTWHKAKGKWEAHARVNGRVAYLGTFPSEEQGAAARYAQLYVLAQSEAVSQ